MKKLGKLSINLERVMKNEELVNLRGGDYYGGTWKIIDCKYGANPPYADPQPCKYYQDIEALTAAVELFCAYGSATLSDC